MDLVFATTGPGRQNGSYHDAPNWLFLLREESLFVLLNWLDEGDTGGPHIEEQKNT